MDQKQIHEMTKEWVHLLLDGMEHHATLMEYYALNHSGADVLQLQQEVELGVLRFLKKRGISVDHDESGITGELQSSESSEE